MNKQLRTALGDKLQFYIENQGSPSVRVAIATGNIDVLGLDTTYDSGQGKDICTLHHHNTAGLIREGHMVDAVLDDASVTCQVNGEDVTIVMGTVDSSKSILHAKRALSNNFRWIKKVTIAASDTTAYNTSAVVASLSPFKQTPEEVIDLNQYYRVDQYQNDKIELEYDNGQLQWNDDFFFALNVPGSVREQITIEFYD